MNKYVQRLSLTQRKHCLGTGQLTVVGSKISENIIFHCEVRPLVLLGTNFIGLSSKMSKVTNS